jgi:hypothetical protein
MLLCPASAWTLANLASCLSVRLGFELCRNVTFLIFTASTLLPRPVAAIPKEECGLLSRVRIFGFVIFPRAGE